MSPGLLVLCTVAANGLELTWSAPPGCPQRDEVVVAVSRLLGAGEPRSTPLAVAATVQQGESGWAVELHSADGGHRSLRGATCEAVARAAEVLLALMVDPFAPVPSLPASTEPPSAVADTSSREWSIGAALLADTNALPSPSPGVGLLSSVELVADLHLELQALAFLPRTRRIDAAGATVGLFAGALGVRRDFRLGPWALAPVLAWEAGVQDGRSFGISAPAENAGFWSAVRVGGVVAWSTERVRFGLRLEAALPVRPPRFVIEGVGDVHTASPVTARVAFTVELRIPSRAPQGSGH